MTDDLRELGRRRVWVIAGATEGGKLAHALGCRGHDVLATVATSAGAAFLASRAPEAAVRTGALDAAQMSEMIEAQGIAAVVDASHPYADEVTLNAVHAARATGTPLLRYERPPVLPEAHPLISWAEDFAQAARAAVSFGSTVFLTVGSRELLPFVVEARRARVKVVARILEDPLSIRLARAAGLSGSEALLFHGKVDEVWDRGRLEELDASVMVMKDSGEAGGTAKKLAVCEELGIPVVAVRRPKVDWPGAPDNAGHSCVYEDLDRIIDAVDIVIDERRKAAAPLPGGAR